MYHELAPTWRKLASEFEGVMRIAPVSCEDDWALCYQLIIEFYQGSYIEYKKSFTLLCSTTRKRYLNSFI
jgi:hypothetical protein